MAQKKKYVEVTAKFYVDSTCGEDLLELLQRLQELKMKTNGNFQDSIEITNLK